jgi:hypothetical protein
MSRRARAWNQSSSERIFAVAVAAVAVHALDDATLHRTGGLTGSLAAAPVAVLLAVGLVALYLRTGRALRTILGAAVGIFATAHGFGVHVAHLSKIEVGGADYTGLVALAAGIVLLLLAVLDDFIDQVLANRDLFLVHQRNQNAFAKIADNERHRAENEDIEERFRRFLSTDAIPLDDRVRMAASVGAVMVALMGASGGGLFGDVPTADVADRVRGIARDILRPGSTRAAPAG